MQNNFPIDDSIAFAFVWQMEKESEDSIEENTILNKKNLYER